MLRAVRWQENPAIPRCVAAVMASLRFDEPLRELPEFSEAEWKSALYYFDRHQLTLLIGARARSRLIRNRERIQRLKRTFWEVKDSLDAAGIEFVALKGFTHWEQYSPDPASRMQYDLDLFCAGRAADARDVLLRAGYESQLEEDPHTDHLPALARKSNWKWNGDFFDTGIPISVELHFRLWDEATEGFSAPGLDAFWPRRVTRMLDGRPYGALHPVDTLGYAALHLLRHLLRGGLRAASVYELAYFLHHNAADEAFWMRWIDLHPPELRRLEAISFGLASAWFGCRMSPAAQAELELLPASIRRWFAQYAASPAEALFQPNKDELWLHWMLLDSFGKKAAVLRRRLIPARLPHAPAQSGWRYVRHVLDRALFHARTLLPTLSRMLRTRA